MSILGLLVGSALAQDPRLPALTHLKESGTFAAARLTPSERKQILEEVERVSFDVPDSWEEDLRVRRVSLGTVEGLVVQGTQRLCRGTGNCETVVLRPTGGTWAALFQRSRRSTTASDSSPSRTAAYPTSSSARIRRPNRVTRLCTLSTVDTTGLPSAMKASRGSSRESPAGNPRCTGHQALRRAEVVAHASSP